MGAEIVSNIRAARAGLRVVEVASFENKRIAGEAKLRALSAGWVILQGDPMRALLPVQLSAAPRGERPFAAIISRYSLGGMVPRWKTGEFTLGGFLERFQEMLGRNLPTATLEPTVAVRTGVDVLRRFAVEK